MLESRTALAYGGSFISYELCDGFAVRKLDTTWLMRGPYWLRSALDPEGGEVVDNIARKFGVNVIHGDEIESVTPANGVPSYVKTKKGREIQTDMIGVGLGITLNTGILANTPVKLGSGVIVNEYLETNVPGVFAAGDVAEFYDVHVGEYHTMGTWDNGMGHGRIAGINMAGGHEAYIDVPTYTSPLPNASTVHLLGFPSDDGPQIMAWAKGLIESGFPATHRNRDGVEGFVDGFPEFAAYIDDRIEERRRDPRDDVTTKLLELEVDGHRLTPRQLRAMVRNLITGGLTTTSQLLGNLLYELFTVPGLEDRLRSDPEALPRAIEESLRSGDLRAISFHDRIRVGILSLDEIRALADPDLLFFNVNTADDLMKADELWRRRVSSP